MYNGKNFLQVYSYKKAVEFDVDFKNINVNFELLAFLSVKMLVFLK
jgi:hypothetical protein